MPSPSPADALIARDNAGWRDAADALLTPNYGRRRLTMVRGEGSRLWDADGREYLDFLTGISVNNLGHCHPRITAALREQAATLVHCSNLYHIPHQIELARLLVEQSFADRAFFCNSGAEANEAAIKIARRHNKERAGAGRHEILTMAGSFHGRTLATISATGQDKVKQHFEPLVEGFRHAAFNSLEAVRKALTPATGAIMVEPIQGEGGVRPAEEGFLKGLRALCDERDMLLIFDEVQCGLGRAGALFAYQLYGVEPDVMTLAKSLGGGLAMGAMLCREPIAQAFAAGSHGTTMGGNALTAAAALAYVSELVEGGWPARADESGRRIMARLCETIGAHPLTREIRGRGLMIGVEMHDKVPEILIECEKNGLLIGVAGPTTLRLLPPLNAAEAEIDKALDILFQAIKTHGAG